MVEKINALCRIIDTINDLPHSPKRVEIVNTLVDMLLAECKKMVNPPTVAAPTTRSAQAEDMWGGKYPHPIMRPYDKDIDNPLPPKTGFHTFVPPYVFKEYQPMSYWGSSATPTSGDTPQTNPRAGNNSIGKMP
jgi:hypothetical protein